MIYALIVALLIVEGITLILLLRTLKAQMVQQKALDYLSDDVGEQSEFLAFLSGKVRDLCYPVKAAPKKSRPAAKKKKEAGK